MFLEVSQQQNRKKMQQRQLCTLVQLALVFEYILITLKMCFERRYYPSHSVLTYKSSFENLIYTVWAILFVLS